MANNIIKERSSKAKWELRKTAGNAPEELTGWLKSAEAALLMQGPAARRLGPGGLPLPILLRPLPPPPTPIPTRGPGLTGKKGKLRERGHEADLQSWHV